MADERLRLQHYEMRIRVTDGLSFFRLGSPLQFQRTRSMRHLMPIVTPRLILRPPTLGDLDSIQTAKEETWHDLQRWMAWAFDHQRSRQAMEDSIRRVMDYQ